MKLKLLMAALAAVTSSPTWANYGLLDGGFDEQGAAVTDSCAFMAGTCPVGAWDGTGLVQSGSEAWGAPTAHTAESVAFVEGGSSLLQTFTATTSGTFRLVWRDQQRQNGGSEELYTVQVNGESVGTYLAQSNAFVPRTSSIFELEEGKIYTLAFVGLEMGPNAALIDSVELVPASGTGG